MTKWYEKSFRRNLVDMHIDDWNEEFLSKFDPEAYFQNLKKAHIKSPMIYVQSHVGCCYWPTVSGHMHNAFKGREDMMRRLFELCRHAGMDVVAYYSLIFNNWAYAAYPEWRMIDFEGKASRDSGERYGLCCPNNPGYLEFIKKQVSEICEFFEFEGMFFDMPFWPVVCYCDSCRNRWESEAGGEIPRVIDWKDASWNLFQQRRQMWMGEFIEDIAAHLKQCKKDCTVTYNNSPAMLFWRFGVNENVNKASEYASGDFYGGMAEQSFACKLYYNLTQNQPFEYMTSRCYPNLLEHTSTKPEELLLQNVLMTYAHHGASMLIDAIDPSGTMDHRAYERMGKVFNKAAAYEKYLEGQMVQDVGVYFDLNGKYDASQGGIHIGTRDAENNSQPHLNAALGAANALKEYHIPFGIVSSWRMDLINKLKVLVLPDVLCMRDEEIEAVKAFVQGGGHLYISGRTAPRLVEEIFEAEYQGLIEECNSYMAPTEKGAYIMPEYTKDYPLPLFTRQVKLSGSGRGEVLATVTLPYTLPPQHFVPGGVDVTYRVEKGAESHPSYPFASIHSNPPGKATTLPAMMRTAYGKGRVIWVAAPIESAMRPHHDNAFAVIIRELGESFSFDSDAPACVELVMFDVPDKKRKLLGMINVQELPRPVDIMGFHVYAAFERKPRRVIHLPDETEMSFKFSGGKAVIPIDKLELFKMIAIEY